MSLGRAGLLAFGATATVLASAQPGAAQETRWLPIVATRESLTEAVDAANALASPAALRVVSSDDCSNLRPGLFLVVPTIATEKQRAEEALRTWRARVTDAYLRACEVMPDNRVALGVPYIDPSIAERPPDTVNWTYEDAVSQVRVLPNGVIAAIIPRYEPDPDDVREGLRVGVSLMAQPGGERRPLMDDCLVPALAASGPFVAIACVTGAEGDNLVHLTRAFRLSDLKVLGQRDHCRDPEFAGAGLSCAAERVDADGQLNLTREPVPLE